LEENNMPDWPHAPPHRSFEPGAYIVTGATLHKARLFDTPAKLALLQDVLIGVLGELGWRIQAWAVMANHYHVVAFGPSAPGTLGKAIAKVHGVSARALNRLDQVAARPVWYQSWDTALTFRRSYFARLRYVHENPVHHGLVRRAVDYPWCSAAWLERGAAPAFRTMLESFAVDRVSVQDDFD
jgi:putative transposase